MYIYEVSDGQEYAYLSWQGDIHNGAADNVYISGLYANKLKLRDKLQVNKKSCIEKNGLINLMPFVSRICRNRDCVLTSLLKYAQYFQYYFITIYYRLQQ